MWHSIYYYVDFSTLHLISILPLFFIDGCQCALPHPAGQNGLVRHAPGPIILRIELRHARSAPGMISTVDVEVDSLLPTQQYAQHCFCNPQAADHGCCVSVPPT